MISIILLIVGVILMVAAVFAYSLINVVFKGVATELLPFDISGFEILLQYGVGGFVGGLGAIFILIGLVGLIRRSKKRKLDNQILQNGIATEATVTFVDKNYRVLINNRPIYSIIEFTYKDTAGNEYTNRIDNMNSEEAIRKQIQVGTTIAIKYSAKNPNQSVIVI